MYKVTCLTLGVVAAWLTGWVLVDRIFTYTVNHQVGAIAGIVWGTATIAVGGLIVVNATRSPLKSAQTVQRIEALGRNLRINPVILRPNSVGNSTDEWHVVGGDDWLAYINEQIDTLAFIPFDTEAEANDFRERMIRNSQS